MKNGLALVIGNAKYVIKEHRLINAANDATDFSDKLVRLGFDVIKILDCKSDEFHRSVVEFSEKLKEYDVGLFYFSGHGLQIENKNYLTSIDTSFVDESSARYTSLPLDELIDYMQKAEPDIKILILDACRDNPLPKAYRSIISQGLAPIHAPQGTIIAFSTSPGEKAMDYGAGKNSIYTGSLLNHIDDLNIPIEEFFKRVRTSVFTLSSGRQTSWEHTSLIGSFYFNSGQLIHSVNLPYVAPCIADENFLSDGSDVDIIIEDLRSHDWYKQQSAIARFQRIDPATIDKSRLFLIGRNILQVACGGEGSANRIMSRISNWLLKYDIKGENHLLNGMLYEIYFNSKGKFRMQDFKNQFIEEIFGIQTIEAFKHSFEFIQRHLRPFRDYLYYIPSSKPKALPIELVLRKAKVKSETVYDVLSVKYEETELLHFAIHEGFYKTLSVDSFMNAVCKELTVPKSFLRISSNINLRENFTIRTPFDFKLSKQGSSSIEPEG